MPTHEDIAFICHCHVCFLSSSFPLLSSVEIRRRRHRPFFAINRMTLSYFTTFISGGSITSSSQSTNRSQTGGDGCSRDRYPLKEKSKTLFAMEQNVTASLLSHSGPELIIVKVLTYFFQVSWLNSCQTLNLSRVVSRGHLVSLLRSVHISNLCYIALDSRGKLGII